MKVERPLPLDDQSPRITELWAWTAIDPMTDVEGIVAAKGRGTTLPLVSSMQRIAEAYRPFAEAAIREAADPRPVLRLRRFVAADE